MIARDLFSIDGLSMSQTIRKRCHSKRKIEIERIELFPPIILNSSKFFLLESINPNMGSNSDHMAFLQRAGISCIDQKFVANKVIQIIRFLSFCFLFIDEKNTFLNKKREIHSTKTCLAAIQPITLRLRLTICSPNSWIQSLR